MSEGLGAAFIWTFEGLLSGVDVCVFFKVLRKGEFLKADHTDKGLRRLVSSDVSSEGEASGEFLVAFSVLAFVRSFHLRSYVWLY